MDLPKEILENSSSPEVEEEKFSSDNCELKFFTIDEINVHKEIHLGMPVKELKCNICEEIFIDNNLFRVHLREHIAHSYKCQQCSKVFIDELSLQTHMQCHEVYYII